MCSSACWRTMEELFPKLVAVFHYDSSTPGSWEAALRHGECDRLGCTILEAARHRFSGSPDFRGQTARSLKQLHIRVLYPLYLCHCADRIPTAQSSFRTFDKVVIQFGNNSTSFGGNAQSAKVSQIPTFCELAATFAFLDSSGVSTLRMENCAEEEATVEEILYQVGPVLL
jgi:hypothetical protein